MPMSSEEFNKLVELIFSLRRASVTLADVEKELTCREKWGKRQREELSQFTTDELNVIIENWHKAEAAR